MTPSQNGVNATRTAAERKPAMAVAIPAIAAMRGPGHRRSQNRPSTDVLPLGPDGESQVDGVGDRCDRDRQAQHRGDPLQPFRRRARDELHRPHPYCPEQQ